MIKKTLIVIALFLLASVANARRIAVLEFNAGAGISQADVDGISAIFNTYFSPRGYTTVERSQIDRVIDEQRLQRSKLTQNDAVRIGQLLNVAKIVVGDVNVIAGEYNLDVRIINVESGTIAAKDGITWTAGNTYRDMMKTLSTRLSSQIAISGGQSSSDGATRQDVVVLYDYLKVFPNELGDFEAIPTNEELALMRAENLLTSGKTYMTNENPRGVVLLVTSGKDAATIKAELDAQIAAELKAKELEEQKRIEKEEWEKELVDLGLPSGTKWSRCYYYVSDDAEEASNDAPTPEQWQELIDKCKWKWETRWIGYHSDRFGNYKITGPNGNSIWIKNLGCDGCGGTPSNFPRDSINIYVSAAGSCTKPIYYTGDTTTHDYWGRSSGFEFPERENYISGIVFLCDWSFSSMSPYDYRVIVANDRKGRFVKIGSYSGCSEYYIGKNFRVIPVSKPQKSDATNR